MKRLIDFLNVCLVTNRGCNLRCDHCYIEPSLLASKSGISKEDFALAYSRISQLLEKDTRITAANVEILGGEITQMPFSFWEQMLPFALKKHAALKQATGKPAALAWCTNMIFKDIRYPALIEHYADDENWAVFIPWEMDSGRFGSKNKLYKKYLANVLSIPSAPKTINIIPTKQLVSMPIQDLVDTIDQLGITDISSDMLYPYGSGAQFFSEHQPTFDQVSQFYINLTEALKNRPEVTLSPWLEVEASLKNGAGFNLNGNDAYDITIEPDGSMVMNSSMTGSEAPLPSEPIILSDEAWALRAIWENTMQMDAKFSHEHETCFQCPFLRYCNGGYYHYKALPPDVLTVYSEDDCPGYKKYWQYAEARIKSSGERLYDITLANHLRERDRLRSPLKAFAQADSKPIREDALAIDLKSFLMAIEAFPRDHHILMTTHHLMGKSAEQRLWFYDALGISIDIDVQAFSAWPLASQEKIAKNTYSSNYQHVALEPEIVWVFCTQNQDHPTARVILDGISVREWSVEDYDEVIQEEGGSHLPSGLVVDSRNDELFRFLLTNNIPESVQKLSPPRPSMLSRGSARYLFRLREFLSLERFLFLHREDQYPSVYRTPKVEKMLENRRP